MKYPIIPVSKPRMTQSDRWKKRPAVLKYWAFGEELRSVMGPDCLQDWLTFHLPMPKTWSQKKKVAMLGKPHQQKPDIDNLVKAVFDSLLADDSVISEVHARKVWAESGAIETGEWDYGR